LQPHLSDMFSNGHSVNVLSHGIPFGFDV